MKALKHRLLVVAVLLLTILPSGCKDDRVIPDGALINIFHDAMIANAYIQEQNVVYDSLLIYEPILAKYGYTVEDMKYTIRTISERKSTRLSDLVSVASDMLEAENKIEQSRVRVLDTIDNVARRTFTRNVYADSLIEATRLKDSTRLFVRIDDIVPGEYTVSFSYFIDSLDENRNSRVEAYMLRHDSTQVLRHTTMLSRNRESSYSRKFTADTSHAVLCINMFYHPRSEEPAKPSVRITNFKIRRVLPTDVSVDSLYAKQLDIRLFNHALMMSFPADTLRPVEEHAIEPDTTILYEPQDSLALRVD